MRRVLQQAPYLDCTFLCQLVHKEPIAIALCELVVYVVPAAGFIRQFKGKTILFCVKWNPAKVCEFLSSDCWKWIVVISAEDSFIRPCLTAAAKEAGNIQMMAINVAKCNTTTMPRGQIIFIQPCNAGVVPKICIHMS